MKIKSTGIVLGGTLVAVVALVSGIKSFSEAGAQDVNAVSMQAKSPALIQKKHDGAALDVARAGKGDNPPKPSVARSEPGRSKSFSENLKSRWFDAPELEFDGKTFVVPSIPMSVAASCRGREQFVKHSDFAEMLHAEFNLSGRKLFPDDIHVTAFRQFIKNGDSYEQFSAEWDISSPPVYKLKKYAFSDPELKGTPRLLSLQNASSDEPVDLDSARDVAERTLQNTKESRAGRILSARSLDASGKSAHEATFLNGVPVSYNTDGAFCEYDFDSKSANCFCDFAASPTTSEGKSQ